MLWSWRGDNRRTKRKGGINTKGTACCGTTPGVTMWDRDDNKSHRYGGLTGE